MSGDPKQILNKHTEDDYLQSFIERSQTSVTADMNQTRVAAEVYLARMIADQADALSQTIVEQAQGLAGAIRSHADALVKSANAAEGHTKSLKWATWALFGATVALAAW